MAYSLYIAQKVGENRGKSRTAYETAALPTELRWLLVYTGRDKPLLILEDDDMTTDENTLTASVNTTRFPIRRVG